MRCPVDDTVRVAGQQLCRTCGTRYQLGRVAGPGRHSPARPTTSRRRRDRLSSAGEHDTREALLLRLRRRHDRAVHRLHAVRRPYRRCSLPVAAAPRQLAVGGWRRWSDRSSGSSDRQPPPPGSIAPGVHLGGVRGPDRGRHDRPRHTSSAAARGATCTSSASPSRSASCSATSTWAGATRMRAIGFLPIGVARVPDGLRVHVAAGDQPARPRARQPAAPDHPRGDGDDSATASSP